MVSLNEQREDGKLVKEWLCDTYDANASPIETTRPLTQDELSQGSSPFFLFIISLVIEEMNSSLHEFRA